ncbi:MAG: glycoside hydrolase family 25 protein [Ginsengibacter sp.]
MARKKKRSPIKSYFKIFFWLCIAFSATYFAVNIFVIKPHIFYPGFEIPIPRGYEIHGIDVSRYQETINWEEVKEMEVKDIKIGFAFIKATEGRFLVDPKYRYNWLHAGKNNVPKGAYHFFIPGKEPKKQARNFIGIVNLNSGDLPPVLDVEISRNISVKQMQEEVKIWLDMVEEHYEVKPIIYTNISFYEKYFAGKFDEYPLWIAHYLQPDKPRTKQDWAFWQHSETGRVNGIKSMVDFNVFSGDSTDFKKLLVP